MHHKKVHFSFISEINFGFGLSVLVIDVIRIDSLSLLLQMNTKIEHFDWKKRAKIAKFHRKKEKTNLNSSYNNNHKQIFVNYFNNILKNVSLFRF